MTLHVYAFRKIGVDRWFDSKTSEMVLPHVGSFNVVACIPDGATWAIGGQNAQDITMR